MNASNDYSSSIQRRTVGRHQDGTIKPRAHAGTQDSMGTCDRMGLRSFILWMFEMLVCVL